MSERVARPLDSQPSHSVVVPGNRVVRSAEVAHVGGRPEITHQTPTIEVVIEANIVRAIDVNCTCGQKMRIWCSYESDSQREERVDVVKLESMGIQIESRGGNVNRS